MYFLLKSTTRLFQPLRVLQPLGHQLISESYDSHLRSSPRLHTPAQNQSASNFSRIKYTLLDSYSPKVGQEMVGMTTSFLSFTTTPNLDKPAPKRFCLWRSALISWSKLFIRPSAGFRGSLKKKRKKLSQFHSSFFQKSVLCPRIFMSPDF